MEVFGTYAPGIFCVKIVSNGQGELTYVSDSTYVYDWNAESNNSADAEVTDLAFIGPDGRFVAVIVDLTPYGSNTGVQIVSSLDQG